MDIGKTNLQMLKPAQKNSPERKQEIGKEELRLRQTSKDMESIFLGIMIKAMEKTIPRSKESQGNNLVNMFFSTVMGKEMAGKGGIGLADLIYESLKAREGGVQLPDSFPVQYDVLSKINSLRSDDE